jgi:tripartite-type tricarboxylate transporter receptor subunit TctC
MAKAMTSLGIARSAVAGGLLVAFCGPVVADPVAEFYQGKTVSFVVYTAPGGAYDTYSRLLARHLGNHLPGHPSFVVQNMPGGGGRTAAGWLQNIAPKDGTVLATFSQSIAIDQALSPEGIRFNAREFNWIGTPVVNNNIFIAWHTSGVVTIDDAKRKQITVGSTGGNSPNQMIPEITNAVLGTKFKIVRGYKGSTQIDLAMERGELEGRGAVSWQSLKIGYADWIEHHKINILFQIGPRKDPELPRVPLLTDLGTTPEQRQILQFISSVIGMGRPVAAAPGVPADRIAALRRAFDLTVRDPEFLADAAKLKLDISPQSGATLQALVNETLDVPPQILLKIKAALSQ